MAVGLPEGDLDGERLERVPERSPAAWHRTTLALLGAVLILALGLRLWGIGSIHSHVDEHIYADRAERMVRRGDPNPHYFQNPSLFTYLVAGQLIAARALEPLAEPLGLPGGVDRARLLARIASAVMGTAAVGLAFATGAVLFGRRVGLLAALFLGVSFLHVRDSHYGVNDVPSAALLLLSLYFDARLLRRPALRWYALAGLAGGLATSTKYTAGFFFVPLVVAHLMARHGDGAGRGDAGTRGRGESSLFRVPASPHLRVSVPASLMPLMAAAAASLVGYLVGTPYTVLDFEQFWKDFRTQYGYGGDLSWGQPDGAVALLWLQTLLQGFGVLPLGLALIGLLLALRRRRAEAALLAAFPAIYLVFFLSKEVFYPRLAIPLLACCALLAAYAASELAARMRPSWRQAGLATLLVAALAQPLANSVQHNRILVQADTRELATEWVRANLRPGSGLLVGYHSLPTRIPGIVVEGYGFDPDNNLLENAPARGFRYVAASSFLYGRDESRLSLREFQQRLEREARLVARIGPGAGGRELPFRKEDVVASPFWSLEQYERPGPTIRIYELPSRTRGRR